MSTPIDIIFERIHPSARLPTKARDGDAAFDLYATQSTWIGPHFNQVPFLTGLRSIIPPGYYCQIVGRSGLGSRGVIVHGGVIDSSYRGEWIVILSSVGSTIQFHPGDRIAQFLVLPVPDTRIIEGVVSVEPGNLRGSGGLGSTGA